VEQLKGALMQYWLWSVTRENWEILKDRRVWATHNQKIGEIVRKEDVFIFYVRGTHCFKGIFRASSDWYKTDKIVWDDEIKENKKKYSYQVDIQPILLGEAKYEDLISKLYFVEKKHRPLSYMYLKGRKGAPVNFGKPLQESDYKLISEEMKKRQIQVPLSPRIIVTPTLTARPVIDEEQLTHEEIEGILLELGNLLNFDTYTADKSKEYKGKRLGEISTLKEIPHFTYPRILDTVRDVDVIWFKDDFPRYCFEVEHTTDVSKGLLRLYQIKELPSKFFIVAPSSRVSKFEAEIRKDPFYRVRSKYTFRSYSELLEWFETAKIYHKQKESFLGQS